MRLIPRVGLFASAATLALLCLGIGFVASRFGPLATLFEPASASVPAAWIAVAVLAGTIALCLLLSTGAKLGARARAGIAILALGALVAALLHAQLLAPLLALVAWFAIAFWREARAAR